MKIDWYRWLPRPERTPDELQHHINKLSERLGDFENNIETRVNRLEFDNEDVHHVLGEAARALRAVAKTLEEIKR